MEKLDLAKFVLETTNEKALNKSYQEVREVLDSWCNSKEVIEDKFRGRYLIDGKYTYNSVLREVVTFTDEEDQVMTDLKNNPDLWELLKDSIIWPGVKQKILLYFRHGDIAYLSQENLPDYEKIETLDRITDLIISEYPRYEEFLLNVCKK